MDVSIVIVNWNTCDFLRDCLASIDKTVPPLTFETIVIDNGSSDGSAEMVQNEFPSVELISCPENPGFAAANNLGIRRATGRYCVVLNPDTKVLPGAFKTMVDFADSHPKVGIVGPKLLNGDGSLQMNGRKFPTFVREALGLTRLDRFFPKAYFNMLWGRDDFDQVCEVDEIMGACMLVRKSAIEQVGMMDERFIMYYEEVDWCLRMKKAGHSIWYLPEACVIHYGGQASAKAGIRKFVMAFDSEYHFFRKHHNIFEAMLLRVLSWTLIALISLKRSLAGSPKKD